MQTNDRVQCQRGERVVGHEGKGLGRVNWEGSTRISGSLWDRFSTSNEGGAVFVGRDSRANASKWV